MRKVVNAASPACKGASPGRTGARTMSRATLSATAKTNASSGEIAPVDCFLALIRLRTFRGHIHDSRRIRLDTGKHDTCGNAGRGGELEARQLLADDVADDAALCAAGQARHHGLHHTALVARAARAHLVVHFSHLGHDVLA